MPKRKLKHLLKILSKSLLKSGINYISPYLDTVEDFVSPHIGTTKGIYDLLRQNSKIDPFLTGGLNYISSVAFPNLSKAINLKPTNSFIDLDQSGFKGKGPQLKQNMAAAIPIPILEQSKKGKKGPKSRRVNKKNYEIKI